MASPREIAEARRAPDRWERTRLMAEFVRTQGPGATVTTNELRQQGFSDAEIFGYSDDVRKINAGRPGAGEPCLSPGRAEGLRLSEEAKRIRARQAEPAAAPAGVAASVAADEPADVPPSPAPDSVLRESPPRKPRRFSSFDAVVQRMHDLCSSVIEDLHEQDLVLISRTDLELQQRRAADGDRLRETLASLLGGHGHGPRAGSPA